MRTLRHKRRLWCSANLERALRLVFVVELEVDFYARVQVEIEGGIEAKVW